ncbi:uncharacterized protein [Typha angustifolia]|uniref:uncharacterized protein isoform X2 n=1 Tax=Typha angustifolia TaxID=59011 RepID=UPI003C2DE9E2
MGGSSIPPTAGAGLEEAEPTQSPLLQLSSNPLAATAVGAIVALASPRLSTNGAEEDIPIHILVFSIIGIFCFCSSRAAPTFLSNHPVIAQCYELIGVLSVGFFLSSLVTIVVLPRHSWVAYTSGLLAMLPLLHKPGQLLYRWLSHSLDSIYQLLIRRFFPAKSLVVFDSENERIKNYKQRTATSHHLKMLWHSYWIIYHLSKILVMEIFCRNMLNWFGSCTMMKIVLLATLNGQCRLRRKTAMFLHRMRSCGVSMGHR